MEGYWKGIVYKNTQPGYAHHVRKCRRPFTVVYRYFRIDIRDRSSGIDHLGSIIWDRSSGINHPGSIIRDRSSGIGSVIGDRLSGIRHRPYGSRERHFPFSFSFTFTLYNMRMSQYNFARSFAFPVLYLPKNAHASSEVVNRQLDVAVGALM